MARVRNFTASKPSLEPTMVSPLVRSITSPPSRIRFGSLLLLGLVASARSFSASSPMTTSPRVKTQMETTVRRYFEGVNQKDPVMIRSCFGDGKVKIRDVCGINDSAREVEPNAMVSRCMEFLAAHPDCAVDFYHGPECGRSSDWVLAHWYETGTWSGESCGIAPTHQPMAVEGQTRFLVDPDTLKIAELVVTRTFTEWEQEFLRRQEQEASDSD